jgi:hypothetical protein
MKSSIGALGLEHHLGKRQSRAFGLQTALLFMELESPVLILYMIRVFPSLAQIHTVPAHGHWFHLRLYLFLPLFGYSVLP